jgi:CBS domain-containing protein
VKVKGIVLWIFGGVAQLEGDSPDPRAELEIVGAGPLTSLALAAVGAVAALLLGAVGTSGLLVSSLAWLAGINALLAVFNLLPAFPLDGGRILRALLWRHWHDRVRATAVAARVGKICGIGLIVVGVVEFLAGGGALGGIWLAVIGWFIMVAAGQQHQQVTERSRAGELRVADAMTRDPLVVPPEATVAEVIERYVRPNRFSAFPVVDIHGRLVGLATVTRMARLPRDGWRTSRIDAAAARPAEIVRCGPDDDLADVAVRMENSPDRRAIVVQGTSIVGILTPSDVRRTISHAQLFGRPSAAPGAAPARGEAGSAPGGMPWGPMAEA